MKPWLLSSVLAALLVTVALSLCLWLSIQGRETAKEGGKDAAVKAEIQSLRSAVERLGSRVEAMSSDSLSPDPSRVRSGESAHLDDALLARVKAVEAELKDLTEVVQNLAPGDSKKPAEDEFTAPDGYTQADQYFEQGKFATAAGGYLAFIEKHPGHPNTLEILKKARDAYQKSGYAAKAIDLQKQILERYPVEDRFRETMGLANLEKEAKRYDDAVRHVEEAVEAATNLEESLWGLGFRAWYIELSQGPEAGLRAYQEAEQTAVSLGLGDSNPAKSHRLKIERLQKIIEATKR